jgi:hypothetical protein
VWNLLKECRGHCTLNISFVEFEKEFADYFFSPYEAIHVLPMTVKGAALVGLFFLHFLIYLRYSGPEQIQQYRKIDKK